ncbi:hypothetical protein [Dictyobacter aurantiacus]|uniref:Uncharacterized protein n=1 Tax=Dictyobacter aurantiacus TaxID=1936993 RepID=A0A401ZQR9_9CHLR|nr:hypothetical protein [Dictyobacter aurantiacus]GCE09223.1 hypothetical protein KDAU_65520 [Dictyobacter aurantiacus]
MPNYGQPLQDYGPWDGEPVSGWFDIAIWPAGLGENRMPLYVGYIKAATAFQAIEDAMRNYGLCRMPMRVRVLWIGRSAIERFACA